MFSRSEDVEAHALFKRGWSISAIARHLECDRKTVRSYLNGERQPGVRRSSVPDPLAPFVGYVKARFVDDPHLWASALFDEVVPLGYGCSYPSFARQVRVAGCARIVRRAPGCVAGRRWRSIIPPATRSNGTGRSDAGRRGAPRRYGLLGTLAHSGRTREVLCESMDQPHLIEGIDGVLRRLGGTTRQWRTDRLATVIRPGTADVQASFAPVAKHYGAIVVPCPPRRGNRKGAVECGVKFMCGRWWRTMTATTPEEAQVSLDRFWSTTGDARLRPPGRYADPDALAAGERPAWPTVGELADAETLMALPAAPYPATVVVTRTVDDRASVAFRGNRYSLNPGMGGIDVTLRHRLGTATSRSSPPPGSCWSRIAWRRRGRGRWSAPPSIAPPSKRSCWASSRRPGPVTARPTARPALLRWPSGPSCSAQPVLNRPSIWTSLAEVIRLAFPGTTDVTGQEVPA